MWCFRWDFCHGLNGVRQIIECAIPPTNRLIYFVLETVVCPTSWPIHHIQHIAKPPNSWSGATVRAWPQKGSEWYKFDVTTAFRKLSDETTATKSIPKYKRDVAVSTSRTFDDSIRRMTESGGGPFFAGFFLEGFFSFLCSYNRLHLYLFFCWGWWYSPHSKTWALYSWSCYSHGRIMKTMVETDNILAVDL